MRRERFVREISEIVDRDKTWQWLSACNLKTGTKALLCAAQEQAIRANCVKHYVDAPEKVHCASYVVGG